MPTIINVSGSVTELGGSLMPPEVTDAMAQASRHFVPLRELKQAAGRRIAQLVHVPAAHVCAGASAGISLMAAACMTGLDQTKVAQLPDTAGLRNQFIVHRGQRNDFDHAIQVAGGKLVEISNADELESALQQLPAAVYYTFAWFVADAAPSLRECAALAHRANVPVIVDAAAQLPPAENFARLINEGADLVTFSGGKVLSGPQASGLILGRADLIQACVLNDSPNVACIGRGMKTGKEEIVGLVKAVEMYLARDRAAQSQVWEQRTAYLVSAWSTLPVQVKREMYTGIGYHVPYIELAWDEQKLGRTYAQVIQALREGEPPIYARVTKTPARQEIRICVHTLQEGEEYLVARRVREALKPRT